MPVYINGQKIKTLSVNGQNIVRAYYGSTLVFKTVRTFTSTITSSQTLVLPKRLTQLQLIAVGGGGAGGHGWLINLGHDFAYGGGGGGGSGGLAETRLGDGSSFIFSNPDITPTITFTIGSGGAANSYVAAVESTAHNGDGSSISCSDSLITTLIANGGGGGYSWNNAGTGGTASGGNYRNLTGNPGTGGAWGGSGAGGAGGASLWNGYGAGSSGGGSGSGSSAGTSGAAYISYIYEP